MLFSSLTFLICFLPVVTILYYTVFRKSRKTQNVFLLVASLGFYAWGEPWFVLVMMGSILCNWLLGLLVSREKRGSGRAKLLIVIMLGVNLGIIFIFKYLMFTVDNLNRALGLSLLRPEITLPIGISFFTFQAISYVIDVYRGRGEAQKNPLNVGLYIAFFPQLIAGPIVRYETIADQIMNRKESRSLFSEGAVRFLTGLCKKVLLANNFAFLADRAFYVPADQLSFSFAWLGAVCYTLQIYYDFSGYSDMAIGLGRMFGFRFLENFNYPYIARSTSEFWRRWHISLGSWFKDYVYFPLGGSRVKSGGRMVFNLFVVWFLTGLWHGANWTFICWGLLYFVSISAEKLTGFERLGEQSRFRFLIAGGRHVYTMLLVIFGWVLFRAETLTYAAGYARAMVRFLDGPLMDANTAFFIGENWIFLAAGILFSMPLAPALSTLIFGKGGEGSGETKALSGRPGEAALLRKTGTGAAAGEIFWSLCYSAGLILLFLVSLSYLVKGTYNPFIYFNF